MLNFLAVHGSKCPAKFVNNVYARDAISCTLAGAALLPQTPPGSLGYGRSSLTSHSNSEDSLNTVCKELGGGRGCCSSGCSYPVN